MRAKQMEEVYYYGMIVGVVVAVAAVLYYIDRKSKDEPMVFLDGAKIAAGAGTLAGGVVYALGGSEGTTAVTAPMVAAVQDMFVGKPEF